ncbi:MAG: ATP synthase F1 subunit delta [Chloroflexi bacterium]|nr:ATP synthase F1 subunit delta [Chloroflexota bacterium]
MASVGHPRRYAEALFQLAKERDSVASWSRQLTRAAQLLDDDQVIIQLSNPEIDPIQVRAVLSQVLAPDDDPEILNLLMVLVRHRRLHIVGRIAELLVELGEREKNVRSATVRTPVPLAPGELGRLRENLLEHTHASSINLTQEVDPSMIGGLTIRIGDLLIDGSIDARLAELREALSRAQ